MVFGYFANVEISVFTLQYDFEVQFRGTRGLRALVDDMAIRYRVYVGDHFPSRVDLRSKYAFLRLSSAASLRSDISCA